LQIPSHQIHNVLKLFTNTLNSRLNPKAVDPCGMHAAERKSHVPARGKRQAIINKIVAEIINKISTLHIQNRPERIITPQPPEHRTPRLKDHLSEKTHVVTNKENCFVFNSIDENNKKKTHTLLIDDFSFLIKRLEKLYGNKSK